MSKRAVIIGGFDTNRMMLRPLRDSLGGFFDDVDVFLFRNAMQDQDEIRKAVDGQVVVTHSAGVMAVARDMAPERIFACNGPIPTSVPLLALLAMQKTAHHVRDSIFGPEGDGYLRIMIGNAMELFSPRAAYGNLRHLREIGRFSTYRYLADAQRHGGVEVGAAVTLGDEFYQYLPSSNPFNVPVADQLQGGHDEVLMRPGPFLAALESQMS